MKEVTKNVVREISISYKPKKNSTEPPKISRSEDAYRHLITFFDKDTVGIQEQFVVMFLDHGNHVIGVFHASKGGITSTVIDSRLILSIALKALATKIIISHNHPSGNLTPSTADLAITQKLMDATRLLDISLLDHLIVSSTDKYLSFADEAYL
jgi:DNA repair protein RadC